MGYLIDTNVLSELRRGPRMNANVARWFAGVRADELFLSVLVIGEIRRGIENLRRRDLQAAARLEAWLGELLAEFGERILPVETAVADTWGRLGSPNPIAAVDGLLAATAIVHELTLVTRNTVDVAHTGVPVLNPFEQAEGAR
jgi:predicted nucleic acid-binding protein